MGIQNELKIVRILKPEFLFSLSVLSSGTQYVDNTLSDILYNRMPELLSMYLRFVVLSGQIFQIFILDLLKITV